MYFSISPRGWLVSDFLSGIGEVSPFQYFLWLLFLQNNFSGFSSNYLKRKLLCCFFGGITHTTFITKVIA